MGFLKEIFLGGSGLVGVIIGALLSALNNYLTQRRADQKLEELGGAKAIAAGASEIIAIQTEQKDAEDRARALSRDELLRRLSNEP